MLAETASRLQCSRILRLAEVALIKTELVDDDNAITCSIWAGQLGLLSFEEYCARYIWESCSTVNTAALSDHSMLLLRAAIKRVLLVVGWYLQEVEPGVVKAVTAKLESAAALAETIEWAD